jgi:hypothetical protein
VAVAVGILAEPVGAEQRPLLGLLELDLELGQLGGDAAPDCALKPQRAPRFRPHHARWADEVVPRRGVPVAAPPDRRRLLALQEVQGDVADEAGAVVHLPDELSGRLGVDARAPDPRDAVVQLVDVVDRDTLDEQVQVEGATALELDELCPPDRRPPCPQGPAKLMQVRFALADVEQLARGQHDVESRRVLHRVEQEHLRRLDCEQTRAVVAEVRRPAPTGPDFARRQVQQAHVLGPARARLRPPATRRVRNSLMQIKGTGFIPPALLCNLGWCRVRQGLLLVRAPAVCVDGEWSLSVGVPTGLPVLAVTGPCDRDLGEPVGPARLAFV